MRSSLIGLRATIAAALLMLLCFLVSYTSISQAIQIKRLERENAALRMLHSAPSGRAPARRRGLTQSGSRDFYHGLLGGHRQAVDRLLVELQLLVILDLDQQFILNQAGNPRRRGLRLGPWPGYPPAWPGGA
jgi:hypothetical protein